MEFPFGRQASKDSLLGKTGEAGRRFGSSITSGSSRLFDSVMSKKNGLFDGISSGITSTIDRVSTISGGAGAEEEVDAGVGQNAPQAHPVTEQTGHNRGQDQPPSSQPHTEKLSQMEPSRQPQPAPRSARLPVQKQESAPPIPAQRPPPRKPPPPSLTNKPAPARPSRPPPPGRGKANGSIRGQPGPGRFSRQQTAPADFDPSGSSAADAELVLNRQYGRRSGSMDLDQEPGIKDSSNIDPTTTTPGPDITSTRISRNPFLDNPDHECAQVLTEAVVHQGTRHKIKPYPVSNDVSEFDPTPMAGKMGPGMLGADLLPGIPRVPSNNTALLAPQQTGCGRDLLAITPTSSEALPMPSIEPTINRRHSDADEIYDDSDGDSEATEGCDEVPDPEDYGGTDYDYCAADDAMFRSGSVGSDAGSWHSNLSSEGQLDDTARTCRDFMKHFVGKVFTLDGVAQMDKAQFGQYCQYPPGRLWFARYVSAQRGTSKRVDEQVFYSLVQYFAVALFECNEADDFSPAKTLMNMCFTFYHEVQPPTGPTLKHFLYSYLKDQSIWQSLRFWNAAFFDAVQYERARRPVPTRETGREGQLDDRQYQENITFGQLGTFTCNMRAFGLSRDLCLEFLRKQSTIAGLREEQVQMLRDNVER